MAMDDHLCISSPQDFVMESDLKHSSDDTWVDAQERQAKKEAALGTRRKYALSENDIAVMQGIAQSVDTTFKLDRYVVLRAGSSATVCVTVVCAVRSTQWCVCVCVRVCVRASRRQHCGWACTGKDPFYWTASVGARTERCCVITILQQARMQL